MEALSQFVHTLVAVDASAVAIVFAVGMVVAPLIILMQSAIQWKQRLKWTAVSLITSWFGLWLYWRREPRAGTASPNRAPTTSL